MNDKRSQQGPIRRVIVRIELPVRPDADYDDLYEGMWLAGYTKVILGESGRRWHLPDGVYTKLSRLPAPVLRDRVVALAKQAESRPRVFVEVGIASAWSGLRPVTPRDPDPDESR